MNLEKVIFVINFICFGIHLFYILFFHLRVSLHRNNNFSQASTKVSIIICARNERRNLALYLESFLKQDYENFEVIVVNDRSWDNSLIVLNELAKNYKKLKIVDIPDNETDHFGKKFALTLGIKAAQFEHILLTDADCKPSSDLWLAKMVNEFNQNIDIVLGASTYEKKKGLLNKLIRFDTAQIAVNYLGFAKANLPYMGVGRNLGYKKKNYESASGFKSHYHVASGDDDLLINQIANKNNTNILLDKDGITISIPENSWKKWIMQKSRHHTTNKYYKLKHKAILTMQYMAILLFYSSGFFLVSTDEYWIYFGMFFCIKLCLAPLIYYKPFKILLCKDLLLLYPFYEFILLICQPIFQINWKKT